MVRRLYLVFIIVAVSACSSVAQPCLPSSEKDLVYVVGQGWHAEIGVPVYELGENRAFYRKIFPGAQVIMFGYGKETFFTAPPDTISEYFLGPIPGPAVIHMVGLRVTPVVAYPPDSTVILTLPTGSSHALSAYIWKDLAKDRTGKPKKIARSTDPDGLFYAAKSEYNLFHTCNTWTAAALHDAGLPISSDNVIFSNQVMARVSEAAELQCQSLR